ncbi:MAG TPA: hypothetical protein VIC26_01200, partial [Marinagarivorans sp.]
MTDITGAYTLNIPEPSSVNPFLLRVSAAEDSTMICDILNCGTELTPIAFGASTPLDTDFALDAFVPPLTSPSATVNVSMLTNIASSLTFSSIQDGESLAARYAISQSRVIDRFGITGVTDLGAVPVVDLTDPEAVSQADVSALNFNLLGPAIVSASRGDNAARSITQAIAAFTQQYSDPTKGLITNADPSIGSDNTDLAEILAQAKNVINAVSARAAQAQVELPNLAIIDTQVTASANDAANTPPSTEGSQGTPSPTAGASGLDKVKAFVAVLGDVGNSINSAAIGSDSTVMAETEAFETQIQAAELATSADLGSAVEATGLTVEAMSRAYEAYDNDNSVTTWTSLDGIEVTITRETETNPETQEVTVLSVSLAVDQDVMVDTTEVAVEMDATLDGISITDDVLTDGTEQYSAMGDVWINGTAATANVILEVMPTSKFVTKELMVIATEAESDISDDRTVSDDWTLGEISLMLDVKIMELSTADGADPITFTGKLETMLSMLEFEETFSETDGVESGSADLSVETIMFSLWGAVANTTGDKFNLSLSVTGDGSDVTFSEMWSPDGTVKSDDETATNYADLKATVMFDANFAGVIGAVKASFSAWRSAELEATTKLTLKWPGNSMELSAVTDDDDTTAQVVTIKNQDNVMAEFTEADGDWTGTISEGGTEYATVDGVVVTYS